MFRDAYAHVFDGDAHWRKIKVPAGETYGWDASSTYVRNPPYFEGLAKEPKPVADIANARILALFGDKITTDHISPAGSIKAASPAGKWLQEQGVEPKDFNQYGTRRGNHEVMMRGTFANIRIKNFIAKDAAGNVPEGGVTRHFPGGEEMSIYDAAMKYASEGAPLVVFAGAEYGNGSSRDWAAKGTVLLGVRAVIARSFERIHRSNLVGMGILPLTFEPGTSWRFAWPHRRGNRDDRGSWREPRAAPDAEGEDRLSRWRDERGPAAGAHRYARRARIFPQRRHPAICAAAVAGVGGCSMFGAQGEEFEDGLDLLMQVWKVGFDGLPHDRHIDLEIYP